MKTKYNIILLSLFFGMLSCTKVFDKENLTQVSGDIIWHDENLVNAFVNKIYADYQEIADWDKAAASWSDEAGYGGSQSVGNWGEDVAYGRISPDVNPIAYWPYKSIRRMNIFFENITESPLDAKKKDILTGQVSFIRAFEYFEMVKRYGGVPIITTAQDITDDLFVQRSSAAACFDFIIKDLDQAIELLHDEYSDTDAGRITKSAAIAFKGRVLLYKASPQFNPSNSQTLWSDAYSNLKEGVTYLQGKGYGLYTDGASPVNDLWFDEMNREAILVTRHNYPENPTNREAAVRPLSTSFADAGSSQPTQELVEAFPMANGLSINDPASGYNPDKYWEGREPRFYTTVVWNGAPYPVGGMPNRIQWTYLGSKDNGGQGDGFMDDYGSSTGYYSRKAINLSIPPAEVYTSGTDWIEIRYAEVLLNLAEAANETSRIDEAYGVLRSIRSRAGIPSGSDNNYGLPAGMDQTEMREAIINERFIELCFENKRFWDLRRWRLLNRIDGTSRHGMEAIPKEPGNLSAGFNLTVRAIDTRGPISMPEKYYFLPMSRSELRNNPKLEQTKGWEDGSFDPLQ